MGDGDVGGGRGAEVVTRPVKSGDEQDVFTGWRKVYKYTQRAGVCKKVKRQANRRERREGKQEAR